VTASDSPLPPDPHWYKDAVVYQLRTRSFYDSNGDGIGDLAGATERLDYLQDLGVTALWLLPFYPSPLRDDGYDIADYRHVHEQCGTMRDFRTFLREAHRRGLRVITELVMNHTSDQHAWFQRARRAPPGSRWRDFYVWSDDPTKYGETRIIFKDFERSNWTWDPVAKSHYWHRFYSHQPDLNFDNPEVRKAMIQTLDHWLQMGVDGLRLDAIPYLFEREGTSCENLPETHAFLKELRAHVDANFSDRMLLAEANQWPEDAVAYFGDGDECHMAFHFPIMPRLFMALHQEDRYPILDILRQTPAIPENAQWAIFLRNHDELTLEMVTDEERDYMWSVYARDRQARINLGIRRRLAPLLKNNRRKIELMSALLLSLPGTPVLYYGDEIGMGDNVYLGDRNGVRTPMQWSADRNAGFSRANPQRLFLPVVTDPEYHYETINVETQQGNWSSLLWWTKRVIALRKQSKAFGRGSFEFLTPGNRKVLAFVRRHADEAVLVVANLSRFAQWVELDLSSLRGAVPVEMFGRIEFPRIGDGPWMLTLGPHAFYWFSIDARASDVTAVPPAEAAASPVVEGEGLLEVLSARRRGPLEGRLRDHLRSRRWFRGKARRITSVRVAGVVPVEGDGGAWCLTLVDVEYAEGVPETYVLPLALEAEPVEGALARLRLRGAEREAWIVDASADARLGRVLLDGLARRRRWKSDGVEIRAVPARGFARLAGDDVGTLPARSLGAEQSNTSFAHGERLVTKLYRKLEEGESLELEVLRHLTDVARFPHVPALAGHLEMTLPGSAVATLGVVQAYVRHEADAWTYTLDVLNHFLERAVGTTRGDEAPPMPTGLFDESPPPAEAAGRLGTYLEFATLLGLRTGEMHRALLGPPEDPTFGPEPYTPFSRRSLYQSMRNLAVRSFETLRTHAPGLAQEDRALAEEVLAAEPRVLQRLKAVTDRGLRDVRMRCHGDYHLGQVLFVGRDFAITDFEGEPARPMGERRLKRSPLTDVAGMLRSFDYAVETSLLRASEGTGLRAEDRPLVEPWARAWLAWVSASFLTGYRRAVAGAGIVSEETAELEAVLDTYLLEKNLYEVGYELNNRPAWVAIPLRGIRARLRP
jgi:maltose alpha-D-glucosyltransferase/alpha-amylase